ncbi:serine hydrolase domain-containing protein [Brevundimonas sp. 2R-24]|uniref:Serine hydrolase domain-containing protein n=1 Tax=Peiella sedimenti TaxID=3061083 RepID=A0ABT8SNI0_9CAUL|nr:serine hydrolase domain-containing protein [Caulobacteraceae bacterium XZ-24]
MIRILSVFAVLLVASAAATEPYADYMQARLALGHFNGSVGVYQNGEPLFEGGYGWSDLEFTTEAQADTRYAVASITKQFTAVAVLQLQEAGRLRLGDSICLHLTPCPEGWRPITIQHLLQHESGLVDYEEPRGLGSPDYLAFVVKPDHIDRIVSEAAEAPLEFTPGTRFHYSNTGYVVLSRMIEQVSGETFDAYMRGHVLEPAGMTQSSIIGSAVASRLAHGYELAGQNLRRYAEGRDIRSGADIRPAVMGRFSGAHGDANLVSTVGDLARWTRALKSGRLISAQSLEMMLTPGRAQYGLGVEVSVVEGRRRVTHTGGLPGYAARLTWYPDEDLTIAVLSNLTGSQFSRVSNDLEAITRGQPYTQPRAYRIVDLPQETLGLLAGAYAMPNGEASITLTENGLEYRAPGGARALLMPLGPTSFYVPLVEGEMTLDGQALVLRYRGIEAHGRRVTEGGGGAAGS